MAFQEFQDSLAEAAPEGTKLTVTITSDAIVFSALPRNKDSKIQDVRTFSTTESEIAANSDDEPSLLAHALEALYPEVIEAERKAYEEEQARVAAEQEHNRQQSMKANRRPKGK